ncbi:hypothetical protein WJX84_003358 [Apatococcus fuscideae]|uniref:Uncharacterized protein n=1 Tax=Apatococcus fuscideae TaxID=2026836 RepID=A0AAW1T821_9CHLO
MRFKKSGARASGDGSRDAGRNGGDEGLGECVAASALSETWPSSAEMEERPPLSARRPKTPRDEPVPAADETADAHTSPNQRVRKHARPSELAGPGEYVADAAGRSNDRPSAALQPSSIPRQSSTDASEDLEVMGRSHSEASGFSRDAAKFPKLNFKGALLKGPR